jgi:hypothetical protein
MQKFLVFTRTAVRTSNLATNDLLPAYLITMGQKQRLRIFKLITPYAGKKGL